MELNNKKVRDTQATKNFIRNIAFLTLLGLFGLGGIFSAGVIAETDILKLYMLYASGILLVVLSLWFLIRFTYQFIRDPKKYFEQQLENQRKASRSPLLSPFVNATAQDIGVFSLLRKNTILALPYILSLILIVGFFWIEFRGHFVLYLLTSVPVHIPILRLLLYLYVLSFVAFSIYMLGYLSLGEILQRKISTARRNFIWDLCLDYFYAIPLIALLALTWIIFLFSTDREDRDFPSLLISAVRSFSLYALFVALKYYTYLNLAIIALEDKPIRRSFGESYALFVKERSQLFTIWVRAGIIAWYLLIVALGLYMWGVSFGWVILLAIGGYLFIVSLVLMVLWTLLSEQIALLLFYIRTRHPEYNLTQLLGAEENRPTP